MLSSIAYVGGLITASIKNDTHHSRGLWHIVKDCLRL